jgi:hypothetical protein
LSIVKHVFCQSRFCSHDHLKDTFCQSFVLRLVRVFNL